MFAWLLTHLLNGGGGYSFTTGLESKLGIHAVVTLRVSLNLYYNNHLIKSSNQHNTVALVKLCDTVIMNFVTSAQRMTYYTIKTITVFLLITADRRKCSVTVTVAHVAFISKTSD